MYIGPSYGATGVAVPNGFKKPFKTPFKVPFKEVPQNIQSVSNAMGARKCEDADDGSRTEAMGAAQTKSAVASKAADVRSADRGNDQVQQNAEARPHCNESHIIEVDSDVEVEVVNEKPPGASNAGFAISQQSSSVENLFADHERELEEDEKDMKLPMLANNLGQQRERRGSRYCRSLFSEDSSYPYSDRLC